MSDIGFRLGIRLQAPQRARGGETLAENGIGADDPKAFLFQLADDSRQKPVIAKRTVADAGEKFGGAPVRPQRSDRRPADGAGKDQLLDTVLPQEPEAVAGSAEPKDGVRHADESCGIGFAGEGEDEKGAPGGSARFNEATRQIAGTGEDAELTRHSHRACRGRGWNRRG